jgi:hypothetical protein
VPEALQLCMGFAAIHAVATTALSVHCYFSTLPLRKGNEKTEVAAGPRIRIVPGTTAIRALSGYHGDVLSAVGRASTLPVKLSRRASRSGAQDHIGTTTRRD